MNARLAGLLWVACLLAVIPSVSARGRGRLESHRRSRYRLYAVAALSLLGLGAVTLVLDVLGTPWGLRPLGAVPPPAAFFGWTCGTFLALSAAWLGRPLVRKLRGMAVGLGLSAIVPELLGEKLAFTGLVLVSGFVEEYVYRGFCLGLLRDVTGSTPLSAILSIAAFAAGHAYRGKRILLRTAVGGAIFTVPVLATGSLLPSILAHVAMDLVQGFRSREILVSLRLAVPAAPPGMTTDPAESGGVRL
ncbi:MAG TPA: CPBP family intramembrane glutamic endopeptidase [Thermoanaerobaculia bacterium]|nr:CPBP family intramembrane glutamic endopeptidase [Thermoanaerobaculia bacterium]